MTTYRTILKACLFAGLLPGVLGPLLWPFVPALMDRKSFDIGLVLFSFIPVSLFSLLGGLVGCVVLGFPILVLLEKLRMNWPALAALIGAALGLLIVLVWLLSGERPLMSAWPFIAFFAILAGCCAGVASYSCRLDKGPQSAGIVAD